MTKEELEKENANLKALRKYELNVAKLEIEKLEQRNAKLIALINAERERQEKCDDVHLRKIAELEKENAKFQEKISILLSCKNCPENKGGWICEKEYEDKCLAQKIEFIKELVKEKCELLGIIQGKDKVIQELEKENAELKEQVENRNCSNCRLNKTGCPNDGSCHNFNLWQPFINPNLTKSKEIIKDYLTIVKGAHTTLCGVPEENRTINVLKLNKEAEQFIKE